MDFHREKLRHLCRICGCCLAKPENKFVRSTKKTCYQRAVQKAFGIDVNEDDEFVHPPEICDTCRCKLQRWWKSSQKKKNTELNLSLSSFHPHSADHCAVCTMKVTDDVNNTFTVDHPSFLVSRIEETTLYVKLSNRNNVAALSVCVKMYKDYTWSFSVHGMDMCHSSKVLSDFQPTLCKSSLEQLLNKVDSLNVCSGIEGFEELCRYRSPHQSAVFLSHENQVIAFEEKNYGRDCIRHKKCHLLVESGRCEVCTQYRSVVSAMEKRRKSCNDNVSSQRTNKSMNAEQLRTKLNILAKEKSGLQHRLQKIKDKLVDEIDKNCVLLNSAESQPLQEILDENSHILKSLDENSPMRLLWQEQVSALSRKSASGNRWHPSIIKWCIAVYSKSPAAYQMMRQSKLLILPHMNTLKQYIYYTDPGSGLNVDVMERIKKDIGFESLPLYKRNVTLVFDEMRVKDGLVYKAGSGTLVGFVEHSDANKVIDEFVSHIENNSTSTPTLATHVLALMVRGICSNLKSVFAYYPCSGFSSYHLYHVLWPAVGFLESAGFHVRAMVADGATPNRKFMKLHDGHHFTTNIYAPSRKIYFFCDVPHLMKTTRNNWENSHWNHKTRNLHYNKQDIKWPQLLQLVEEDITDAHQLRLLPKITYEHLHLNPSLRMKVKLAAQVLSSTVKNAFQYKARHDTKSTEKFVEYFDKFFDLLNVSNITQGNRKPNMKPYSDIDDVRFTWLEKEFLGFLDEWEQQCLGVPNMKKKEQRAMCLSLPTLEGLRITVKSFVALTKELLGEGVEYILSEKFTQDPLEEYFSKQRGLCGHNTNPTVSEFGRNALAIQVSGSKTIRASVYGNCTNANTEEHDETDNSLPRRKRQRTEN